MLSPTGLPQSAAVSLPGIAPPTTERQTGTKAEADRREGDASPASTEALATVLNSLIEALRGSPVDIRFTIDAETHRVVTKLVSRESGDTIRQIPSEEALRISRAIDRLQGLLIEQTA
ncbi:flagellar protein FlaG [Cupriavidus sp. L7L]|uniref:flagellar protein FlaG n=1 Tax=Cupriavidus sp. L7L TaxID=2546443 RepID=UPI0010548D56|nr:flagellar protein FlaG [Cupriavidus sp. L7L]TDF64259.1 flagellar protein FlaG [Cupriavidus sp. L7L]